MFFIKKCCLEDYQTEDYELINGRFQMNLELKKGMPTNYDADLMKIIIEMLNKEAKKRPDSGKVLDDIKFNCNNGVDKIYLYDNNNIYGERFEEVINEYIEKGFFEIIDFRGKNKTNI